MDILKLKQENELLKKEIKRLNNVLQSNGIKDYEEYKMDKAERMKIFREYFHAREDVFAFYFMGRYYPACYNRNKGKCYIVKKSKKCSLCNNANFIPLTDEIVKKHISTTNHRIGIYPLFSDHKCYFVAIDFDEDDWFESMLATYRVAKTHSIDGVMERSSSGNGGHLWFFFAENLTPFKC